MKKAIKVLSLLMAAFLFCIFTFGSAADSFKAKGVDVSFWQKEIDFSKVKADGIDFVILRIGTTYGKDSTFEKNYENAKKAGLDVGCYFYTYAKTPQSIQAEADEVIKWIGNKKFEYPVYLDLEDMSLEYLSKDVKMSLCESFITYLEQHGFCSGLYCNSNWLNNYLDKNVVKEKYNLWLAKWTDSGKPEPDKRSECDVWQYSATGNVNGIEVDVDMDISYVDYPTYIKENGLNNYPAPEPTTQQDPEDPENPDDPTEPETPEDPESPTVSAQMKVLQKVFKRLMEIMTMFAMLLGVS